MGRLRLFWRSMFDVRPGEYARLTSMTLYLMLVLFAYYILKPVSRAIFLNRFDIDKLPWLYVLIAAIGGVLAYFYTKLAVNSSLKRAVDVATVFSIGVLIFFWWAITLKAGWIVYAFNIWVSLFSIILVSQGWLIAANIFTSREAKRLYGILGVGSVIGAAFGGTFTAFMVRIIGTTNLILASAGMVLLSYIPFLAIVRNQGARLTQAKAAGDEEQDFSFAEILGNLRRVRHLQVIMAIMIITFVIDVMVEFQFNAEAKLHYHNKNDLTAFLGNFYGFWLNLITFIFQFFLTGFVVSRFGVGGTLQIMPGAIALASIAALVSPSVLSTGAARLTEASTRYSFNKTGMELLYLPLPLELRNRTKAFVDVFVDRFARGLGGILLVLLTVVLGMPISGVALVVMIFALLWIGLSFIAQREYVATVRKRLESRRLDLGSARLTVDDPATIQMLQRAALSNNWRQSTYALSLLAEAKGFDPSPLLRELQRSPSPEVRARVYDLAADRRLPDFVEAANGEIRSSRPETEPALLRAAVRYVLKFSDDVESLAARLLQHPHPTVPEATIEKLASGSGAGIAVITPEWLRKTSEDEDPQRRRLAALAARLLGEDGHAVIHKLLSDDDPRVVEAAFASAAAAQVRNFVLPIIHRLPDPRLRGAAVKALASFGSKVVGTCGDLLEDESAGLALRRQIPRALRLIPTQRSVDTLLRFIDDPNLTLRSAVLRALNRLRETNPDLDYGPKPVNEQILAEAKYYFEMNNALLAFEEKGKPSSPAGLLVNTLQDRLRESMDRLFRLLGLKYPSVQVYSAYLAVRRRKGDQYSAALDFLDNTLDRDLKRIILPLLDDPALLQQRGRDLFGMEPKTPEEALRNLIGSGDEWLAACAVATAGQLGIRALAPEIQQLTQKGGEIGPVALQAAAALA